MDSDNGMRRAFLAFDHTHLEKAAQHAVIVEHRPVQVDRHAGQAGGRVFRGHRHAVREEVQHLEQRPCLEVKDLDALGLVKTFIPDLRADSVAVDVIGGRPVRLR
jgi:hypothetical protein